MSEREPMKTFHESGRVALALGALFVLTAGAGSNEPAPLDLALPVRLLDSNMYLDGGTVFFVLSDARGRILHGGFDGQIRIVGDDVCPQHCFVGGDHPTEPGVRFLPLWGSEERKLVHLLVAVISDTASPAEVEDLVWYKSGPEIPEKLHGGIAGLVRAVEARRRTLEAIDHGLLWARTGPVQLFAGADTARAESLVRDRTSDRFAVTFHDAKGGKIRIGYSASPDSVMASASFSGERFDSRYPAGTVVDRMMVTTVSRALKLENGNPTPSMNERDRSALLDLLKVRTAKILEADKDCTSLDGRSRQ